MADWVESKEETDKRALVRMCGPRELYLAWQRAALRWPRKITYCLWTAYAARAMIWHTLLKGATPIFLKGGPPPAIDFIMAEAVDGVYNHALYAVRSRVRNQVDYTTIARVCEKDRLVEIAGAMMAQSWPADAITAVAPGCVYIVKPVGRGAMSNAGVAVVSTTQALKAAKAAITAHPKWRAVVCEYLTAPALYRGFKFHLRAHILVRSWAPATWFNLYGMYLAAKPYREGDWEDTAIHTTHFTGNDMHPIFPLDVQNEEWQRLLDEFMPRLCALLPRPKPYAESEHAYELLAPDLLISNGRVYVLEINHKPGRKGADTPAQARFDRAITEWEFEHGAVEILTT